MVASSLLCTANCLNQLSLNHSCLFLICFSLSTIAVLIASCVVSAGYLHKKWNASIWKVIFILQVKLLFNFYGKCFFTKQDAPAPKLFCRNISFVGLDFSLSINLFRTWCQFTRRMNSFFHSFTQCSHKKH